MSSVRDSRRQIIQAARAEFAVHGFAGARTRRIAERAQVNKQLLFYYFGSKRGLWDAVVAQAGEEVREQPTQQPMGAQAVRTQLVDALQQIALHPDAARLLIQHPGGDAATGNQVVRRLITGVERTISLGQGIGFIRDDADPRLAARQLTALALGYLVAEDAFESRSAGDSQRSAWMERAVDLMLAALRW